MASKTAAAAVFAVATALGGCAPAIPAPAQPATEKKSDPVERGPAKPATEKKHASGPLKLPDLETVAPETVTLHLVQAICTDSMRDTAQMTGMSVGHGANFTAQYDDITLNMIQPKGQTEKLTGVRCRFQPLKAVFDLATGEPLVAQPDAVQDMTVACGPDKDKLGAPLRARGGFEIAPAGDVPGDKTLTERGGTLIGKAEAKQYCEVGIPSLSRLGGKPVPRPK